MYFHVEVSCKDGPNLIINQFGKTVKDIYRIELADKD